MNVGKKKKHYVYSQALGSLLFVNFPREISKVQILKTLSDKSWEFMRITCGHNILFQYPETRFNEICTN